jgi:hypothetical protein
MLVKLLILLCVLKLFVVTDDTLKVKKRTAFMRKNIKLLRRAVKEANTVYNEYRNRTQNCSELLKMDSLNTFGKELFSEIDVIIMDYVKNIEEFIKNSKGKKVWEKFMRKSAGIKG